MKISDSKQAQKKTAPDLLTVIDSGDQMICVDCVLRLSRCQLWDYVSFSEMPHGFHTVEK